MSWLRRKPLRLLMKIAVLYDNDKILIYSNNDMHKERKKNRKICLEQLHLSIKGNSSINSQRFFLCSKLRTDDHTKWNLLTRVACRMSATHRGERCRHAISIWDAALDRGHIEVCRFCLFHTSRDKWLGMHFIWLRMTSILAVAPESRACTSSPSPVAWLGWGRGHRPRPPIALTTSNRFHDYVYNACPMHGQTVHTIMPCHHKL